MYTFEVCTAEVIHKLAVEVDITRLDWINDINEAIRLIKASMPKKDVPGGFSNYVADRRVEARQLNKAAYNALTTSTIKNRAMVDISVFGIKKEGELVKKGGKRKVGSLASTLSFFRPSSVFC